MAGTVSKPSPFAYFFAGLAGEKPDDIPFPWRDRFGLDGQGPFPDYPPAAIFPNGCTCKHIDAGPGGGPGLLATPYTLPPHLWGLSMAYPCSPASFAEVEVAEGVWLIVRAGFDPFDVARKPLLAPLDMGSVRCVRTMVADARQAWIVPCCLPESSDCVLPMVEHCERGTWRTVPKREYATIATVATMFHRAQTSQADPPTRDWVREAACAAIAVNYDITAVELGALGLLGDDFYAAVLALLTAPGQGQR